MSQPAASRITVIEPGAGWLFAGVRELLEYRDLLGFLTWRHIRVRYAQSVLGVGWSLAQPLASVLAFTLVFGRLAGVPSEGHPYALFAFVAILPWNYFAGAVGEGAASLVTHAAMVRKIYFPRIVLPLSVILAKLVDFAIGALLLALVLAWNGFLPTRELWCLPLLMGLLILASAGPAIWLSVLAVQYRDVSYASGFLVQLLLYAAPVIYPASLVPERFQLFYALNPMVGVIEGFRAVLLGPGPVPWASVAVGAASALCVVLSGLAYFQRRERFFADVA